MPFCQALDAWIKATADGDDSTPAGLPTLPQVGAAVILCGLVSKPELNGACGTLLRKVTGSDGAHRWQVSVTSKKIPLSIRTKNFIVSTGGRKIHLDDPSSTGRSVLGLLASHVRDHDPADSIRQALALGCNPNTTCLLWDCMGKDVDHSCNACCGNSAAGDDAAQKCREFHAYPLIAAAANGHYESCRLLLEANASPHCKDQGGYSAIYHACMNTCSVPKTNIVSLLLDHDAKLIDDDGRHFNIPRFAAKNNHVDTLNFLLAELDTPDFVPPNKEPGWYRTPLMEAVQSGSTESALALIAAGADASAPDSHGKSSFHVACMRGCTDVVQACLKIEGFDIDAYTTIKPDEEESRQKHALQHAKTALQLAVIARQVDVVTMLLEGGASVNKFTDGSKHVSALELALGGSSMQSEGLGCGAHEGMNIVECKSIYLRERMFRPEFTALNADADNEAIIGILLQHGALLVPGPTLEIGSAMYTFAIEHAIRAAAAGGNVFALKHLFQECTSSGIITDPTSVDDSKTAVGADPDPMYPDRPLPATSGMTALALAASHCTVFAESCKMTTCKFCLIDAYSKDKIRSHGPHHQKECTRYNHRLDQRQVDLDATQSRYADSVSFLVHECSSSMTETEQKAWKEEALWFAVHYGHVDTARVLLEQERSAVDIDTFGGNQTTLLMESAKEGHIEMVVYLLHRGADPEVEDVHGANAAVYARNDPAVCMAMMVYGYNPRWSMSALHSPIVTSEVDFSSIFQTMPTLMTIQSNFSEIFFRERLGLGPRREAAMKQIVSKATESQQRNAEKYPSTYEGMHSALVDAYGTLSGTWSVDKHWMHSIKVQNTVTTIMLLSTRFANKIAMDEHGASPLWLPTELWTCFILPFVLQKPVNTCNGFGKTGIDVNLGH